MGAQCATEQCERRMKRGRHFFYLKAMSARKTNRPSKEAVRKARMAATPNGLCMAKSVIKPIVEPP